MRPFSPDIEHLLGPASPPSLPAGAPPSTDLVHRLDGGASPAMMGGAYDGASRFDNSLALWAPPLMSADQEILADKPVVDARVRDTLRNDAYVASGANLHRDNIVGAMFLLNAKPNTKVLGLDETWEEEFQEEVEAKFTLWAESPNNWPDASRMNTLTGLVRLAVGIYVAAGELLATAEWEREPGRPFKTAVQIVDLDRLSNPGMTSGTTDVFRLVTEGLLKGGVERNTRGAPQAYWIQTRHPSETWFRGASALQEWKRVPARKPWGRLQVIHILEQTRPDQSRGIADMAAALKELRITKRFRDITLQNAVVNATFAAAIESELPTEAVFQQLGGASDEGAYRDAVAAYANGYLGAVAGYAGGNKAMHLDGVKIPHLFPGTKLHLHQAGKGGPLGADFERSLLRYIAANLNVSYEQLSRDYTSTNYSSARAAMAETWKFMQARKQMVADRFASHVYRLWLEEAINGGLITALPRRLSIYEGMNFDALSQCDWIGASRGQIDELKETQAAVLRIKFGLSTREDELARLGRDWRKVFAQLQREERIRLDRGLTFAENDPAMNAASGSPRDEGDEPEGVAA